MTARTAITVPFSELELELLAERAAAHRLPVIDFVRICALSMPTPLEPSAGLVRGATRLNLGIE